MPFSTCTIDCHVVVEEAKANLSSDRSTHSNSIELSRPDDRGPTVLWRPADRDRPVNLIGFCLQTSCDSACSFSHLYSPPQRIRNGRVIGSEYETTPSLRDTSSPNGALTPRW